MSNSNSYDSLIT